MGILKPREPVADKENNIRDVKQAHFHGEVASLPTAALIHAIPFCTQQNHL
jgi:hypothetical protein